MKVIYDCDNTMGVKNRDIDDGLALVYLAENSDVELLGVTVTYGNEDLETVYRETCGLVEELGLDVRVYKGRGKYSMIDYEDLKYENSSSEGNSGCAHENEAAVFIADTVNRYPGEVCILATGSMQNLYDAMTIDESITGKARQTVLMGGITEDLVFNGKIMKELNFSICSEGSYEVLSKMNRVSTLTGNNCMKIPFTGEDLESLEMRVKKGEKIKNGFLVDKIRNWMDDFREMYDYDMIYLWDVIAAIYLTNPELFRDRYFRFRSTEEMMKRGYLDLEEVESPVDMGIINLPEAVDFNMVNRKMIKTVF